jgi:hypothetical protein
MMGLAPVPLIFTLLAAMFLSLALIDYRKHGSATRPARKAWLRIGLIFAAVSIYLFFFQGRER